MPGVGRFVKVRAKPGQGDPLARALLEVAATLRDFPGCEQYVINRSVEDPDVIWVAEQWSSQEQVDAAVEAPGAKDQIPQVMALVQDGGFERFDVEPLGGVGYDVEEKGFTVVSLDEVEDMAAKFGLGDTGEARFARGDLGAVGLGISIQRLHPGARQSFGHHHRRDEEIYVIVSGSGRVAIDDELRDVHARDAIRVAPGSVRAFEAGPDGLEFIVVGTHHAGDPELKPGFWPE